MRSKESDSAKALVSFRNDLINGPLHCFGIHKHCSPDFCKTAKVSNCVISDPDTGQNSPDKNTSVDDIDGMYSPTETNYTCITIQLYTILMHVCCIILNYRMIYIGIMSNQEMLWRDTLADDDEEVEREIRQGRLAPTWSGVA